MHYTGENRIPKECKDIVVHIDASKFSQVLRNVISNALKFVPKDGSIHVTLSEVPELYGENHNPSRSPSRVEGSLSMSSYVERTKYVKIDVADNGPGLTKVYL